MELGVQAKLLRLIQDGELYPVGEETPTQIDVRILAATNRNLEREVAAGRFRADLFWRLNVIPVEMPPLRERAGRHRAAGASTSWRAPTSGTSGTWPGSIRRRSRRSKAYRWPGQHPRAGERHRARW